MEKDSPVRPPVEKPARRQLRVPVAPDGGAARVRRSSWSAQTLAFDGPGGLAVRLRRRGPRCRGSSGWPDPKAPRRGGGDPFRRGGHRTITVARRSMIPGSRRRPRTRRSWPAQAGRPGPQPGRTFEQQQFVLVEPDVGQAASATSPSDPWTIPAEHFVGRDPHRATFQPGGPARAIDLERSKTSSGSCRRRNTARLWAFSASSVRPTRPGLVEADQREGGLGQ